MANILTTVDTAISTAESDIVKGVKLVSHVYTTVEQKINGFLKDEPQLVSALGDLIEKGEIFLAAAAPAIGEKGLSLPADSAAFAALEAFLSSFEKTASAVKSIVNDETK